VASYESDEKFAHNFFDRPITLFLAKVWELFLDVKIIRKCQTMGAAKMI